MADPVKRFSPFFTQGKPGGSEILDRNLLAIQQAMEQANVTIVKNTTDITRIISGDINISVVGPAGPPGMPGSDAGDGGDGDALSVSIPGPPGVRGRDGVGIPGQDAEEVDAIVIPGRDGQPGRDGATLMMPADTDDAADAFFMPPLTIVWPLANRVVVSTGPFSPPVGNSAFQWDITNRVLFMGAGATQTWANVGNLGDANTEYVESAWSGNVWILRSKKTGAGTVRSMTIDADTATLTLKGNSVDISGTAGAQLGYLAGVVSTPAVLVGGTTSVSIAAGTGTHPSQSFAQSQIVIDTSIALAGGFPAGSTWNGLNVTGSASVPGAGTITAVFGSTKFSNPTITGTGVGATVNEAATVLIAGGPIASALTINVKYALYVQGDVTRLDGQVWLPTVANGAVATALTSVGPVGSHTTVQKWFVLYDTGGTAYYVPGF